MYENLKNKNLFNFDETIAADIFTDIDSVGGSSKDKRLYNGAW